MSGKKDSDASVGETFEDKAKTTEGIVNVDSFITMRKLYEDRQVIDEDLSKATAAGKTKLIASFQKLKDIAENTHKAMPGMLARPQVVYGLACNGQGAAIIDLLNNDGFTAEDKTWILSADWAVAGLAFKGQAEAVIKILQSDEFTAEQKTRILSANQAEFGLVENGQREAVQQLKAELGMEEATLSSEIGNGPKL